MSKRANVVAGPGEKSFSETYDPAVTLPMSEKDFLSLLARLGLRYELYGRRQEDMILRPFHGNIDLSKVEKCYQVYGRIDPQRHFSEKYVAYVDADGRVVYIENSFSYPPL